MKKLSKFIFVLYLFLSTTAQAATYTYSSNPKEFVTELISIAKGKGVFIAADSQCSSQLGNVGRFKGADLLTPTEHKASAVVIIRQSPAPEASTGFVQNAGRRSVTHGSSDPA